MVPSKLEKTAIDTSPKNVYFYLIRYDLLLE
jgi:hypothetical protein